MKKAKSIRSKEVYGFVLDKNSILQKFVKLKYTIELTIVVLRKLTSLIIIEFHSGKGHQGISCTVNMIRHYFWCVGMCRDIHQHINSCQLCIQFLPNQLHTTNAPRNPKGSFCWMCHGLHCPSTSYLKRQQACTNIYMFAHFISNHDTP